MSDNKQTLACVLICLTYNRTVFVHVCANIDSTRVQVDFTERSNAAGSCSGQQITNKRSEKYRDGKKEKSGLYGRELITTPNNALQKRVASGCRLDDNRWSLIAVGNEESLKRKH